MTLDRINNLADAFEALGVPFASMHDHGYRKSIRIQLDDDEAVARMAAELGAPAPERREREGFQWFASDLTIGTLQVRIYGPHTPVRGEVHELVEQIARLT